MSIYDLKGLDTGKVGNNKGIDLSFSEYMDQFGGGTKKKEIPKMGNLKELAAFYGFDTQIPGIGKTVGQLKTEMRPKDMPKGTKILYDQDPRVIGNSGIGTILPEDAPMNPISRTVAGFLDRVMRDTTDFDKRGVEGEGLGKIDFNDLSQYELLPDQQNKLNQALELDDSLKGNATSSTQEAIDSYLDFKKAGDTQSRKGRVLDSALEFLNYNLVSPKIRKDIRDDVTFKQQQLLDAEAIKQGLPNAVQSRAVAAGADFAQQAQAVAAQQDAATIFAGLGMQRPFGQPSFKVS